MLRRRLLGDEGVHPRPPLLVGEAGGDHAGGELVGLLQAEVHLLVEGALARGHGGRRLGGKVRSELLDFGVQLVGRNDAVPWGRSISRTSTWAARRSS